MSGANVRIIPVAPKIIEQAVITVFVFMICSLFIELTYAVPRANPTVSRYS
jgi:hypothetical protein